MKRVFGVKKDKEPPPSVQDAAERINKRGDSVDEKVKKLDIELARYKEQIKKTRPGPAQEAIKFPLPQTASRMLTAQNTMAAMKSANKELKGSLKTMNIEDIDNMQDEMMNLMDISSEIQDSLGRSYSVPDDIDEDELMGELDALEADMGSETQTDGVPAYLQPDRESDLDSELNLPSAPSGRAQTVPQANPQATDEFGLPIVPRASLRS